MIDIIDLLSTDGYIMCNKKLIRLFGGDCAILIGELCAEYNYYKANNQLTPADSFYSTQENIELNTGLNPYAQRKAFKILTEAEIIKISKQGLPAKNYYWLNKNKLLNLFTDSCLNFEGLDVEDLNINNNKQNNNKKVLSKDNTTEQEFNFGYSEDKPKKKNLYHKCLDLIHDYTDDSELRNVLTSYLDFILEKYKNEGKVLYANQWKGLLNKLDDIEDKILSVHQSIEKGYVGFYPIGNYSKQFGNPDTNKATQKKVDMNNLARNKDGSFKTY